MSCLGVGRLLGEGKTLLCLSCICMGTRGPGCMGTQDVFVLVLHW